MSPSTTTQIVSDPTKLDLVFMLDTTGSMGSYIHMAKTNILRIADELVKSERCHLRIGLVNYNDHPAAKVTDTTDLTDVYAEVKNKLEMTTASGGADEPEAVCCAMHDCLNVVTWRPEAVKIAILITDAPPHGLNTMGDSFPKGN
jgi:Mg-chelatase subunit ChlD